MTVMLTFLAAVGGGLFGALIGFLVVVALGYATGTPANDGGIEMGAALVGAPVGLIVGALLAGVMVLRARRRHEKSGPQGWIALGLIGSVLIGLSAWLFYTPPEPTLRGPARLLISEIRVPWSELDADEYRNFSPNIQTWNMRVLSRSNFELPEREGDEAVWRSTHELRSEFEDRELYLPVSFHRILILDLELPAIPPHQPEFTEWIPPTHVREHS